METKTHTNTREFVLTCELRRRTLTEVESDLHSETEFDTSAVPLSDGASWMALRGRCVPHGSAWSLHLRVASSNEADIKIPRADGLDFGGLDAGGATRVRERRRVPSPTSSEATKLSGSEWSQGERSQVRLGEDTRPPPMAASASELEFK
jgi:hypothetical protein